MDGLNPRQAAFVREFLLDRNATQAYIRAGYSRHGAPASACRLLTNAKVAAAIEEADEEARQRGALSVDWIIERLREEAVSQAEDASAMSRIKAVELLGKHIGMWPKQPKVATAGAQLVLVAPEAAADVDEWRERVTAEISHAGEQRH